jgi:hypothetical protein
MFKDVAYFCHSHLLALLTIGNTVANPTAAFDERLIPANPLYLQKVLTPADITAARALIAQVSRGHSLCGQTSTCTRQTVQLSSATAGNREQPTESTAAAYLSYPASGLACQTFNDHLPVR